MSQEPARTMDDPTTSISWRSKAASLENFFMNGVAGIGQRGENLYIHEPKNWRWRWNMADFMHQIYEHSRIEAAAGLVLLWNQGNNAPAIYRPRASILRFSAPLTTPFQSSPVVTAGTAVRREQGQDEPEDKRPSRGAAASPAVSQEQEAALPPHRPLVIRIPAHVSAHHFFAAEQVTAPTMIDTKKRKKPTLERVFRDVTTLTNQLPVKRVRRPAPSYP